MWKLQTEMKGTGIGYKGMGKEVEKKREVQLKSSLTCRFIFLVREKFSTFQNIAFIFESDFLISSYPFPLRMIFMINSRLIYGKKINQNRLSSA